MSQNPTAGRFFQTLRCSVVTAWLAWTASSQIRCSSGSAAMTSRLPQRGIEPVVAGSASSGRASHSFTVWSSPAEASRLPSGLNATL